MPRAVGWLWGRCHSGSDCLWGNFFGVWEYAKGTEKEGGHKRGGRLPDLRRGNCTDAHHGTGKDQRTSRADLECKKKG